MSCSRRASPSSARGGEPKPIASIWTCCCGRCWPGCVGSLGCARWCAFPSVEEEDARRPGRERDKLVRERVGLEKQIQSLLCLHGIGDFRPRLKKAAEKLEKLRARFGAAGADDGPVAAPDEAAQRGERTDRGDQCGAPRRSRIPSKASTTTRGANRTTSMRSAPIN